MRLWSQYIAWVDRDVRESWPFMFGYSGLVPLCPLIIVLAVWRIVEPGDVALFTIKTIGVVPMMLFLPILFWRAFLEGDARLKRVRKSPDVSKDDG